MSDLLRSVVAMTEEFSYSFWAADLEDAERIFKEQFPEEARFKVFYIGSFPDGTTLKEYDRFMEVLNDERLVQKVMWLIEENYL